MSFDLNVIVKAKNWPTIRALNSKMLARRYPIQVLGFAPEDDKIAFAPVKVPIDEANVLAFYFEGEAEPTHVDMVRVKFFDPNLELNWFAKIIGDSQFSKKKYPGAKNHGKIFNLDFEIHEINTKIKNHIADSVAHLDNFRFDYQHGDYLVTSLGRYGRNCEWNAGIYILDTLVQDFSGYGFELQGGLHGRQIFSDQILDALYE